ncbi:unnamed protein product [marine sediment metagenome]|uniref:Uncharacterized protein n=1 Tax=marine sediment metagenome TaxID=412755 RepID=X1MNC0_9ZZZZ
MDAVLRAIEIRRFLSEATDLCRRRYPNLGSKRVVSKKSYKLERLRITAA